MNNDHREKGDNLCSKDKHLKYKWQWSRIASQRTREQTKNWTHFQCSESEVGEWELGATLWGSGENVRYEATISFKGNQIESKDDFGTRLYAQIGAERLLEDWIQKQYKIIIKNK